MILVASGCGCGSPLATSTCGSTLAGNITPLELILGAVDVSEPLQRIRAQGEAETRPVGRMHDAVGADVERLVEELPHHRHPALAYLENVAVGRCHRDVNAGGEQNATAPGMRRQTHAVRRGQCRNTPDLGDTAGAGTSGCAMSSARRSSRSWKSNRVNSRSPEAIGIVVERRTST